MMARVRPSDHDHGLPPRSQSSGSLKFDEQAQLAEDVLVGGAVNNLLLENEGEEGKWIRREIKCRECRSFVPVASDSSDDDVDDRKCKCGYRLSEHKPDPQTAMDNGQKSREGAWEYNTHTSPIPTNTFGEIEFVGFGDKVAKYVRVDTDTNMNVMKKLMTEKWKMERPNLLISVTGGAKNFLMRAKLKEAFRRGLMKAALSTGAWIVTGGTAAGVMKHVGEAVRDYGLTAEGRVICIGIAPWGCVQNKEVLIDPEGKGKWPALYRIQGEVKPKQSFLDPNHTHFILVDNGTQRQFTTEIEFRAKLEKEISQWTTNAGSDAVRVPVALLVLEGGPGTLKTVMNAIKNNTPAIIIKGSGKCADVLAYAAQNIKETEVRGTDAKGRPYTETIGEIDENLKAEIKTMVEQTFGAKDVVQNANFVEKCVTKPHLISVFELEGVAGSITTGVDMAILKALLKANKDQVMDQLRLALAWNRIDIAKSEIFTDDRPWPTGALDDMMMSAVQLNRVDFVDLFLDNGVSLKDFLTVRRLLKFYNEIPKNCHLYSLLLKVKHKHAAQRQRFSLEDVGFLLQDLLGDYFQPDYLQENDKPKLREMNADAILSAHLSSPPAAAAAEKNEALKDGDIKLPRPAQDLFLWAVLMNQQDLAKLFWREGNESTAAALVANSLLKAMRRDTDDSDMVQRLQKNADEFEALAIGVINNCYVHDEQKAQDLLIREMKNWGKATCVLIAVQADNKRFVSQTACQSLLNSIWMGKMSQDNGLIRLISSMFIFPLICYVIKFKDQERLQSETYTPGKSRKALDHRPTLKREMTEAQFSREATAASLKVEEERKEETVQGVNPSVEEDQPKRPTALEKFHAFYTTPVVIFILNCLSYLIFLGLYSYILVVQLSSTFHFLEGILIIWVFTIFVEEMRQLVTNYAHSVRSKLVTYITDSWNMLDIITILLFTVGMILRFIPNDTCFSFARVVLSLNLVSFFFRILHIFSVNKELGPKLVMIRRMIRDLMWFVVILMVFIGAYAIASEAILYPETELSWKLLYHLPRKAYWQIYGELFLEDIEGDSTQCTNDPLLYSGYNQVRCPSEVGKYLVPVLTGIYILMTNVLLLNLLIAMFSYTFETMQNNTDNIWRYMQLQVVMDYSRRPVLPPPFIAVSHLLYLCQCLARRCCLGKKNSQPTNAFRKRFLNHQEEKKLVQWENIIADTYLTKVEAREADSVEGRVKVMMHKLESMQTKIDHFAEVQSHLIPASSTTAAPAPSISAAPLQQPIKQVIQMPPQLEQRLGSLEQQMGNTYQALSWIMQAMEASNMTCGVSPPALESPTKQKDFKDAEAVKRRKEKKEARKRETKLRQEVSHQLESRLKLHVVARSPIYPNCFVCRFPVPDDKVPWEVPFEDYDPVDYTADSILNKPYADKIDLIEMPVKDRIGLIPFNNFDKEAAVSRISFEGQYKVVNGLPLNPIGRTGIEGRGLLGRWGPNIAGDPLLTRWKCDTKGKRVLSPDGKPVLEFVAVKRTDNKLWAIPGAVCTQAEAISLPGEEPWNVLWKYFTLEALGSLMDDPKSKANIDAKLKTLSEKGATLYQGYADDARNTDNAWLETCVVNYHDDTGDILYNFDLRAGQGTSAVSWLTVSSKIGVVLHGSHSYFLKLAADKLGASF
ncbi:transient receptor potential cation channel subfamily M member-like 2 [Littorina saxatilis]|uniref:transient receptor potential cation channel subfamily M member-like 2 n=1 Tax=Littorina saxatilis TaxID=31220 RepID=UPI0038B4C94A